MRKSYTGSTICWNGEKSEDGETISKIRYWMLDTGNLILDAGIGADAMYRVSAYVNRQQLAFYFCFLLRTSDFKLQTSNFPHSSPINFLYKSGLSFFVLSTAWS